MARPLSCTPSGSFDCTPPFPPASLVSAELAMEIEKRAVPWPPSCDRILFHEGDPAAKLYLVRSGQVNLTLCSSNYAIVCFRYGPNSLIGLSAILGKRPYAMTATADEDAGIAEVDSEAFLVFIQSRPELYLKVLRILAAETLSAYKILANMIVER